MNVSKMVFEQVMANSLERYFLEQFRILILKHQDCQQEEHWSAVCSIEEDCKEQRGCLPTLSRSETFTTGDCLSIPQTCHVCWVIINQTMYRT